jgi:hypothetical protein
MYPVPTKAETQGRTDKYIGEALQQCCTRCLCTDVKQNARPNARTIQVVEADLHLPSLPNTGTWLKGRKRDTVVLASKVGGRKECVTCPPEMTW